MEPKPVESQGWPDAHVDGHRGQELTRSILDTMPLCPSPDAAATTTGCKH